MRRRLLLVFGLVFTASGATGQDPAPQEIKPTYAYSPLAKTKPPYVGQLVYIHPAKDAKVLAAKRQDVYEAAMLSLKSGDIEGIQAAVKRGTIIAFTEDELVRVIGSAPSPEDIGAVQVRVIEGNRKDAVYWTGGKNLYFRKEAKVKKP